MKKLSIVFVALFAFIGLFAQSNSESSKMKKVETIKIIDGDTVMHDVRMVDGDVQRSHYKKMYHMSEMQNEEFKEMEDMLEDVEIFMHMDNKHKQMMVQRLGHHDIDLDSILKGLDENEDIIIDIDKKNHQIKVIKIDIDDLDDEETVIVEIKKGKMKGKNGIKDKEGKAGYGKNLRIYPNPSNDEFTIDINAVDDITTVSVVDETGKSLFEKTYKKAGKYKEKIILKGAKKGFVVVTMSGETIKIQKKLVVE